MKERFQSFVVAQRHDPLAGPAGTAGLVATSLILGAALVGASVRLLPWVLDPSIAWATLAPFAKSLLAVALEAALMTGWPVGWALATQRLVDRGEARVLASLGEPPPRTVLRLGPQAAAFALVLVIASVFMGREATAPGRVVNALLGEGHASCMKEAPATKAVPFVGATWLCEKGAPAHLVGRAPIGGVVFTADDARVSDDLRRIELDRARLGLPVATDTALRVRVGSLVLRGLAPWARASSLPPVLRALVVVLSALGGGAAAAIAILLPARRRIGVFAAAVLGAAGPLAALVTLRALELRVPEQHPGAWLVLFVLVPVAAVAAVALVRTLVTALPERRRADSK